MLSLPPIHGRYAVGATTFVTPVRSALGFGPAKRRKINPSSDQLEPVLCMEEVGFTAYYPAEISSNDTRGLDWLLRPVGVSLLGYSLFAAIPTWILWPMVYLFGIFIKAPVYANAPLLRTLPGKMTNGSKSTAGQWPLVIFSHGLGGSRTAYSHLCSRIAASGKVVLAIEHRDGTGHACLTRSWGNNGQKVSRPVYYLKEDQAMWEGQPAGGTPVPFRLRAEQLEFRRKEIYIAYSTFHKFLRGDETALETIDGHIIHSSWRKIDNDTQTSPVRCEDVTLMGHSFGGCTVLSILSTPPSSNHEHLPTSRALILDPWLEPLPIPGPIPHLETKFGADFDSLLDNSIVKDGLVLPPSVRDPDLPQMLVVNSETFTLWDDHFTRLRKVVKAWEPDAERIITLVGCKHQSFSDFPILPLIKTKEALKLLQTTVSVSLAFLDSNLEQHLQEAPIRDMETLVIGVKDNGKLKRKLLGNVGDIIVH